MPKMPVEYVSRRYCLYVRELFGLSCERASFFKLVCWLEIEISDIAIVILCNISNFHSVERLS